VAVFATYRGGSNPDDNIPSITIWGTFPADIFESYIGKINQNISPQIGVSYVQKSQASFSNDFIAALARGKGPDAILIPADMLLPHMDKVMPIPFNALPQRDFMDNYIDEGQIYLNNSGIMAIPFIVDPLVMYWNRDIFSASGIASYPKFWDEFVGLNKQITEKDANDNIRRATVAMGDFTNVNNARELLGTLLLQSGNPITKIGPSGYVESALEGTDNSNPLNAIDFFTQFVNPNSTNYSWNRGMSSSKTAFLSQKLATYFGFASELKDIRAKNQNLNFDVAPIPQLRSGGVKATYGRIYGLSIVRASSVPNAAYQHISTITNPTFLAKLSDMTYLPSVNLGLIGAGSDDPYITAFNKAALITKTWFDADPEESYKVFGNMISTITSGANSSSQALNSAHDQYEVILRQAQQ